MYSHRRADQYTNVITNRFTNIITDSFANVITDSVADIKSTGYYTANTKSNNGMVLLVACTKTVTDF